MTDLTATQILVLTSACERDDGVATRPSKLNRSAAVKVAAKLIERGLMQEQRAKLSWPVWRLDADNKAFSLKVLKLGRAFAKAAAGQANPPHPATAATITGSGVTTAVMAGGNPAQPLAPDQPKTGFKRTLIIALMQREGGASLADLTAVTGWLPHTTRAALTGLRKSGIQIIRSRDAQATSSVYKIEQASAAAAA